MRHDVLVTTDETFKAKTALIKSELDPHVIIWDECHWSLHSQGAGRTRSLSGSDRDRVLRDSDYLTTTAKRDSVPVTLDNGQVLYGAPDKFARAYYPELLDERTARWGIQHKRLAPLAWGELDFTLELDDVPVVDGPGGMDYDQAALQNVMRTNWPFVVTAVRKLYERAGSTNSRRASLLQCALGCTRQKRSQRNCVASVSRPKSSRRRRRTRNVTQSSEGVRVANCSSSRRSSSFGKAGMRQTPRLR